ncbi:hypothetical protein U1Q18_028241 [Sarracenia purpurea var. burkii]
MGENGTESYRSEDFTSDDNGAGDAREVARVLGRWRRLCGGPVGGAMDGWGLGSKPQLHFLPNHSPRFNQMATELADTKWD